MPPVHDGGMPASVDALDVGLLRVFAALHRERHLTRAANALDRSQPGMSRALARLRAALGDPLFVRTPGAMVPTPRADALAPEVARLLEALAALTRPTTFAPATLRRAFTIAAGDMFEADLLPRLMALLAVEAPDVDVVLRPVGSDAEGALRDGRVDVLIAPRVSVPPGVQVQHLYDDHLVCAVRAGHPTVGRRLTLAQFVALGHVQIAPRMLPGGPVDDALAARGLRRRIVVRTPSFVAAPLVVSRTDLVMTGPSRVLTPLAASFGLRLFAPPLTVPGFRIDQAWHPRFDADVEHRWLRGALFRSARARS